MNWLPVILLCVGLWFCFGFCFGGPCLFVLFCVFFVFGLVVDDDGLLDYVQVLHQFFFVALNSRWPRVLICNYCFCNAIERIKRPGGSHEGAGRKKSNATKTGRFHDPKWHPDQASKTHTEPAWALPSAFGFAAAFAAFAPAAMASAKRSNLETTAKSPCRQKFRQQHCRGKTGN